MGERNDIINQQEVYISFNQRPLRCSTDSSSGATTYNHPRGDLLEERARKHYYSICVPLYYAILGGDWKAAKKIFEGEPIDVGDLVVDPKDLVRTSITENMETPLHVAVRTKNSKFVEKIVEHLLKMMKDDDLKLQNGEGNTAFCVAAMNGNIRMADKIIQNEKNHELLTIRGSGNLMPLHLAVSNHVNYHMVRYLYEMSQGMTSDSWTDDDRNGVFLACVTADIFDVPLQILDDTDKKGFLQDKYLGDVLHQLAVNPDAFHEEEQSFITKLLLLIGVEPLPKESEATYLLRRIWKTFAEKPKDIFNDILIGHGIDGTDAYRSPTLFAAAKMGNAKYLVELIRKCPDLIWKRNEDGHTIFHIAVLRRNEGIYNLLYEFGSMSDTITKMIDKEGNNMLHLAAKIQSRKRLLEVSGAAFQMQLEWLWFREVERMVHHRFRDMKNKDGLTPYELLTQNHQALASEGEAWIKGTVNQLMVAAALIATIGFSVVFSIPGGFDQNNGFPIFLRDKKFTAFVIFDAISFILSSISILASLSLTVSRYAEHDFIISLPTKLMIGQVALFLSIFAAMAAFSASFFIIYHNSLTIIIGILVIIPILFFIRYQYDIFMDNIRSVYRSRHLFRPKKRVLYHKNPTF